MLKYLFSAVILSAGPVLITSAMAESPAQIVDRAADCAAISLIETSAFTEKNAQAEMMTQRSMLTSRILSVALSMEAPGKVITNGDISTTKGDRARTLNILWTQDPQEVHAAQRLCWEWFAGIFEHVQAVKNQPGIETDKQALESALSQPVASLRRPFDAQRYEILDQILRTAFENWRAMGSITTDQMRDILERDPVKKGK